MSCEYVKREILVPKRWEIPKNAKIEAYGHLANPQIFTCRWYEPEPYTFPSFLPDGWWIAMDEDGRWWLYESIPEWDGTVWFVTNHEEYRIPKFFIWTPPTVKDAASSLMQVKHVTSEKEP